MRHKHSYGLGSPFNSTVNSQIYYFSPGLLKFSSCFKAPRVLDVTVGGCVAGTNGDASGLKLDVMVVSSEGMMFSLVIVPGVMTSGL